MIKKIFYNSTLEGNIKKTKILSGLIYIKKDLNTYNARIRVFGVELLKAITIDLTTKYQIQLPTITLAKKNIIKDLVKDLGNEIPQNTDAYIFTCRSGEFFLTMHHFEELIKQYHSKNIIVLTPFNYHISIFKMFYPEIPIKKIPQKFARINRNTGNKIFVLNRNCRIIIPINFNYYQNFEKRIQENQKLHFYEELQKELNVSSNIYQIPRFRNCAIENCTKKIQNIKLNNKFVIVSLGSQSNEGISDSFWIDLALALKEKGYDIYFNSMTNNIITENGKTCFMNHEEISYLATLATATIGLRSGFMDVVAPFSKKCICLYTDFKERRSFKKMTAKRVITAYSLKSIPNTNNINEYMYKSNEQKQIITNILEDLHASN